MSIVDLYISSFFYFSDSGSKPGAAGEDKPAEKKAAEKKEPEKAVVETMPEKATEEKVSVKAAAEKELDNIKKEAAAEIAEATQVPAKEEITKNKEPETPSVEQQSPSEDSKDLPKEKKNRFLSVFLSVISFLPRAIMNSFSALNRILKLNLTAKITLFFAAIVVFISGLGALILLGSINTYIDTEAKTELNRYYLLVQNNIADIDSGDYAALEAIKSELKLITIDAVLKTSTGSIVWDTGLDAPDIEQMYKNESWVSYKKTDNHMYMSRALSYGGKEYHIYLSNDLNDLIERNVRLSGVFAWVLIFALAAIVAFSGMAGAAIIAPIKKLAKETREIGSAATDKRINVGLAHDELKELAEVINTLLDNTQQTISNQERFVGDAAHEIRTPISIIKGNASLIRRWGHKDTKIMDESLSAIEKETVYLSTLVDNMLFLAKSEQDIYRREIEIFSLNELVDDLVRNVQLVAANHIIDYKSGAEACIKANKPLISQLLRIILDNAVKYTPKGGFISVSCTSGENVCSVVITDTGMGIAPNDLPHIFERFYRADKARTRSQGGNGLGMAIAKKIADAYDCEILVQSSLGHGTKVSIMIPACNEVSEDE